MKKKVQDELLQANLSMFNQARQKEVVQLQKIARTLQQTPKKKQQPIKAAFEHFFG